MAMLAWLPSRPTAVSVHAPLTVSRAMTVRPRSVKGDRRLDVADGDADVVELDGNVSTVSSALALLDSRPAGNGKRPSGEGL
jgi:hypothetical protein